MNSSFWGKIRVPFFIGILILVLAAGFFLYERLRGGVELGVVVPQGQMELGVPFEMELTLANNSANALKNVRVQMELPDNVLFVDKPDERIIIRGIGDMVNGRVHRETFKVVAVPGEDPSYKIEAVVYYVPASISANLQRRAEAAVGVRSPDASLELSVPERIFSGEEFTANVFYRNNLEPKDGNYTLELKISHPPEAADIARSPEPKGEGSNWRLEETGLREGSAALRGRIELPDEATFAITAQLVMKILGKEFPVISNAKNISINPSPLAFKITLASGKQKVAPGEELTYIIQYRNNATVPLEDAVITAGLKGEMFNIGTLETNGAADLLTGTLLWSPLQIKELEILEPGEGGQVSFAIKVKEDYPAIKQTYTLEVRGRIESPTPPPPLNVNKAVNLSSLEVVVETPSGQQ